MAGSRLKTWSPEVLTYRDGARKDAGKVRRHYFRWRQDHGLPVRCDKPGCHFHTAPLVWNGKPLKMVLDHKNGVNTDDRPCNLQLLCPNCDSQQETRGGGNKDRVRKSSGGFGRRGPVGWSYELIAEPGMYRVTGGDAELIGPSGSEPEEPR